MDVLARAETANIAVHEYRCYAGPNDAPFNEAHRRYSISIVRDGSFGYVYQGRLHELVPGSLLIGAPDDEYVCTHEHHACGDECLSFQFSAELVDAVAGDRNAWRIGGVPPVPQLMIIGELAQAVIDGRSAMSMEEVAHLLLMRWFPTTAKCSTRVSLPNARERQRVIDIARWIDACSHEDIDLERTARAAGMAPHRLLRTFSRVLGVTPHQYLIRARLRHAARLLTDDGSSITQIASAVGFADLSNFIRTFGKAAGMSPLTFRRTARGEPRGAAVSELEN